MYLKAAKVKEALKRARRMEQGCRNGTPLIPMLAYRTLRRAARSVVDPTKSIHWSRDNTALQYFVGAISHAPTSYETVSDVTTALLPTCCEPSCVLSLPRVNIHCRLQVDIHRRPTITAPTLMRTRPLVVWAATPFILLPSFWAHK